VRAIPDDRTVRYYGTIGLLDRPSVMRGRTALYGKKHVAQVVAIKRLQGLGRSLSEIQTLWPTLDAFTLARMSGVELEVQPQPPARAGFWRREPGPQRTVDPSAAVTVGGAAHDIPAGTAGAIADPDRLAAAGGVGAAAGSPIGVASRAPGAPFFGVVVPVPAAPPSAPIVGVVVPVPAAPASAPHAAVELRVELAPHVILSLSVVDESVAISPADVRALRAAAAPLMAELASRRITPHPGGEEP
jgi:hypothetical protein